MTDNPYLQSNDLDKELADAERRWAGFDDGPMPDPQPGPTCPNCGSDEVYGGAGERERACPRCGLQYDPRDYCELCNQLLDPDSIEAGETVCLDCVGGGLSTEIDLESHLLAIVRVRLG